MEEKILKEIKAINSFLDRVSLRAKGNRLFIRGTFPPKPGEGLEKKRYEISTGLSVTPEGLRVAKARAMQIDSELNLGTFQWGDETYSPLPSTKRNPRLVKDWVEAFTEHYWMKNDRTPSREQTYRRGYLYAFSRLPQYEPLTEEILIKHLVCFIPGSKNREIHYIAFSSLARFANIAKKINQYRVSYKPKVKREILTEAYIESIREEIKHPGWQWIFGVLATYGLRPHEVFNLNCDRLNKSPYILEVKPETKTGERLVYPVLSHWPPTWNLSCKRFPDINTENMTNMKLGNRVSGWFCRQQFKTPRLGENLTAYHLRDFYAVRLAVMGVDSAIVAQWMGHHISMHHSHYLVHIDEISHTKTWEEFQNRQIQLGKKSDPV